MDRRLRGPLAAVGRVAAVTLAVMVVTAAATGWLYWLRAGVAHWPGPQVRDALPLDELPGHDHVPLTVFALVFGIAGVVLGLVARVARLHRLSAGGGPGRRRWDMAAGGRRVLPVGGQAGARRARVPCRRRVNWAYLSAALVGAGGALLGRSTRADRIAHRLLTWMVAIGGLIDLMSALMPRRGAALGLVERFGPGVVIPAAHALLARAGMLLLIGSRGLARRNRRAWQLCVALLGLSAALNLLRGPDYAAAIVTGLIAVALVASRQNFPFRGDPAAEPSALLRLAGMLAAAMVYGIMALSVYRAVAGLPFSLPAALWDSVRALAGLAPHGSQYLPGGFSRWFPASVLSIAVIGVLWAAEVWVRPWRQLLFPAPEPRSEPRRSCAALAATPWRRSPCGLTSSGSSPARA